MNEHSSQLTSSPLPLSQLPIKVVVFTATPMSVPTINRLFQQQLLGGVVMPRYQDGFTQQLQGWLSQQHIPFFSLDPQQLDIQLAELRRWETDLAISFGVLPDMSPAMLQLPSYGFYTLLTANPSQYTGPMPHYWQLRDDCRETQLTLQSAIKDEQGGEIAMTLALSINPLDTLSCLENQLAQRAPELVSKFITQLRQQNGEVALQRVSLCAKQTAMVTEKDLYVDWIKMSAQQISAMTRAGNPNFGGCIVRLGNTELNLLQATVVSHPTFGVEPGTICHTGDPEGVIVATCDGAIRLDILSNADGVFSAINFVVRFGICAGMVLTNPVN